MNKQKHEINILIADRADPYIIKDGYRVNEGPSVLIHNGKIFVAFSASGTGPEYCEGLLYADLNADLMNPSS